MTQNEFLRGQRINPKPITGKETVADLVDNAFLAYNAWHDSQVGEWPGIPHEQHRAYSIGEIKAHLRTFVARFFGMSQFKRSAVPNSPKVGSGGSLSPRGDWRAGFDPPARTLRSKRLKAARPYRFAS